jgi:processive 1,2-diacylglycerol beta-glucosyltransferase
LQHALQNLQPEAEVQFADALERCKPWFRAYYNSYTLIIKLSPALWRWIESMQHQAEATSPGWIYELGAKPLFRYLEEFAPDLVIATEVGACELAALYKRQAKRRFLLAGVELMDFNRAWIQPEVDLLLATHPDLAAELVDAGASASKVITTGQPIDPLFADLPGRGLARKSLGIDPDCFHLLVLLGGQGMGNPHRILPEIQKVRAPLAVTVIAGRNRKLERRLQQELAAAPHIRVVGWVDNIQDWMVASDVMISKPGGGTLSEGFACGLPMLAFDPLPGNEERTCGWIEKWNGGKWLRRPEDIAPAIDLLMSDRSVLETMRAKSRALARPQSARDGALALLNLLGQKAGAPTGAIA